MIYEVKFNELMQAAQLLRAYPEMDRETFYATMESANPQELTQEQIEQAIQYVTQSLVDLKYVSNNDFDQIAPWIRSLEDEQVPVMVKAIYDQYRINLTPLRLQYGIDQADLAINQLQSDFDFVTARRATLDINDADNERFYHLLDLLLSNLSGTKDEMVRKKSEIESQLALVQS